MIPRTIIVHVGGPGRDCRPGLVLIPAHVSRVRVLMPSAQPPVGSLDEEGDVRNWREMRWWPTPAIDSIAPDPPTPPSWRAADTWHYEHECGSLSYPPEPAGPVRAAVIGG